MSDGDPQGPVSSEDDEHAGSEDPAEGIDFEEPLVGEGEGFSVGDADLVETGLREGDLSAETLGIGDGDSPGDWAEDAVGIATDEDPVEGEGGIEEAGSWVDGSEPGELPGAADDLLPGDGEPSMLGDGGEEGIEEDGIELQESRVPSPSLDDPGGGDDPGGPEVAAPWRRREAADAGASVVPVDSGGRTVESLFGCPGGDPIAVASAGDDREGDPRRLQLVRLGADGLGPDVGPALRLEAGEAERLTSVCVSANGRSGVLASDRGLVRCWEEGLPDWVPVAEYVDAGGRRVSWLALGLDRRPFRLLGSDPLRVWAWRSGGPVLRRSGDAWRLVDGGADVRALVSDPGHESPAVLAADDDGAVLRRPLPDGSTLSEALPDALSDTLLAPGAAAVAAGGAWWVVSRDPEASVWYRAAPGAAWTVIAGRGGVRLIAGDDRSDRAAAVRIVGEDEGDGVFEWTAEAERLLVGVREVSSVTGRASDRFAGMAAVWTPAVRLFLVHAGRLVRVVPADGAAGARRTPAKPD